MEQMQNNVSQRKITEISKKTSSLNINDDEIYIFENMKNEE